MAYGIDFTYCVIGMAVITAIYVILGGYKAIALNDFVQGIIMLVGIICVIGVVLNAHGGFTQSLISLSQFKSPMQPEMQGAYVSIFGPDPIGLLGVIILTSLGAWGLPQMIHKFYTIKNEKAIKIGAIVTTVFALIIAGGSYFIGSFGKLFVDTSKVKFDDIVPNMLGTALQGTVGDILMGVVVILVLSASMSTLSSLVISSSSTVTIDFIKQIFSKDMKDHTQVLVIKILCGFFIFLSVAIAIYTSQPGIVTPITTLMSISWGAIAGAFLPAFLYGLFWKGVTKAGVWSGFVVGIGITVANAIPGLTFTNPPNAGALAMLVTLVIVPLVSIVTPKFSKEHIDKSFICFQKKSDEFSDC
jgi:SSS family solute:Na+ symporter